MWKLRTTNDYDAAAARLFGYQPKKPGERLTPYKANQFKQRLGVDITQYRGFYAEVAGVESPVGPVTPATERLQIRPILAIRQSHSGMHHVFGLEYHDGFFNRDKTRAWIRTDDYLELFGDEYFQKIFAEVAKLDEAARAKEPDQHDVRVVAPDDLSEFSPREQEIMKQILAKEGKQ